MAEKDGRFPRVFTKIVTPFESDGSIDWFAFDRLLSLQAKAGNGVAIGSISGERKALRWEERQALLEEGLEVCGGQSRVLAVAGAEEGEEALRFAAFARDCGAGGLLLEVEKTHGGLYALVRRILEETGVPVIVERQNGKGNLEIYRELSALFQIGGIAERAKDPLETKRLSDACRETGTRTPLFCGREERLFLAEALTYEGVFSECANLFPKAVSRLFSSGGKGIYDCLFDLLCLLGGEEGVSLLKWGLHRQGRCLPTLRLPLVEPDVGQIRNLELLLERTGRGLQTETGVRKALGSGPSDSKGLC